MSHSHPSPFRIPNRRGSKPDDPENLFWSLNRRSPDIPHLWAHQADVLRSWHSEHLETRDIAFELPTGTGKTLIGLLIGEFIRQNYDERVVYLCPNRQLAHQVGSLAADYSIDARVLVGRQVEYEPEDFNAYANSSAIAVTTYSAIFNTNPKINSANLLILDDAHASEDFISSLWNVEITRDDHETVYLAMLDLFEDAIPGPALWNLKNGSNRDARIECGKIPSPVAQHREAELRDYLDTALTNPELRHPWSMIRGHLNACHIFVTWSSISIRPIYPPTFSHAPFADARRRIYMSATLGAGGELERITGVREIDRLRAPKGWDRQGTGRRFILFPDWSLTAEDAKTAAVDIVGEPTRSLILTPNKNTAQSLIQRLENLPTSPKVFKAPEIENSLEPFLNENHAALVLHNRYDGLDLPGDACHLEWICDLPGATNPQEAFLMNRLGIHSLFRDRIRTRLTQALGRCTRNPTDHAVVIMSGPRTLEFCIKGENKSGFHPELQAEIEYGLTASQVDDADDFIETARGFLTKKPGWEEVDEWIRETRDSCSQKEDEVAQKLMLMVRDEIDYGKAMWVGDHRRALEKASTCVDGLGGKALARYRAWWNYLAGSSAALYMTESELPHLRETARELFERACNASPETTWFWEVARFVNFNISDESLQDPLLLTVSEAIEKRIQHVGVVGAGFEKEANATMELLACTEPPRFEQGLERLGKWLGVDAKRPSGQGVPDGIWTFAEDSVVAFEAKSEENPAYPISLSTARQAQGHINWVKSEHNVSDPMPISAVVISDRSIVAKEAVPNSETLFVIDLASVRGLGQRIISTVRSLRAQSSEINNEDFLKVIAERLKNEKLDPRSIQAELLCNPLSDFPVNS